MAIQLPNPGLGDGQTGDNEFVMWTKVKDNFTNTTHAASRLVGTATSNLVQVQDAYSVVGGIQSVANTGTADVNGFSVGTKSAIQSAVNEPSAAYRAGGIQWCVNTFAVLSASSGANKFQLAYGRGGNKALAFRNESAAGTYTEWVNTYTTANTTKDVATGFLKASSPVLHVYNDKITKIHEAEQLDITVDKKGVGHYEIHGTTGLRHNDGWNMSPPRDLHGNVLCMIDVTEEDGVVILKTYKRKFDLELAAIVHDYDNPLDIPDGACVEFRFNDLPYENLDDTQTEV